MRVTLTGKRYVHADSTIPLKISVINGESSSCRLDVNASTFEVKIVSGSDRIWSTKDCPAALGTKLSNHELAREGDVGWTVDWPGKRSAKGCKLTGGLRNGTYVATAQLTLHGHKAKPVRLVMEVR